MASVASPRDRACQLLQRPAADTALGGGKLQCGLLRSDYRESGSVMQSKFILTTLILSLAALIAGCGSRAPHPAAASESIVWVEQGIAHDGFVIDLGYRGELSNSSSVVEPVAAITRDGKSVANAMVFTRLSSPGDQTTVGQEMATVYEPSSAKNPPIYAGGRLQVPEGASLDVVQFRIVLPDVEQDWVREMAITTPK